MKHIIKNTLIGTSIIFLLYIAFTPYILSNFIWLKNILGLIAGLFLARIITKAYPEK